MQMRAYSSMDRASASEAGDVGSTPTRRTFFTSSFGLFLIFKNFKIA